MGLFSEQIEFLKEFRENKIHEALKLSISDFGFVLKDFIVNKQLFREGIDGQGKKLRGYARTTIRLKISKGQPADRTTLHDEEDFVNSIQVDDYQDRFEISSDVAHDKYIIKKYGINVLSPTNENMKDFMEKYFLPKLKQYADNEFAK